MSAPTHPPRRANDYDVQCVLQAFGFESTKHFEDVLAGRRPSALKEPSIWRGSTPHVPARPVEIAVGLSVNCWNSGRGRYERGEVTGFGTDGRVIVRRTSDGHSCRYSRRNVKPVDRGAR